MTINLTQSNSFPLPPEVLAVAASFLTLQMRHKIFKLVCRSFKEAVIYCDLFPEIALNNKKEKIITLFGTRIIGSMGGRFSLRKLPVLQFTEKELRQIRRVRISELELLYLTKIAKTSASVAIVQFYNRDEFDYCLFGRVVDLSTENRMTSIVLNQGGDGTIFYENNTQYHYFLIEYFSDLFKKAARGNRRMYYELIDPNGGTGGWGNNLRTSLVEGPKLTSGRPTVSFV